MEIQCFTHLHLCWYDWLLLWVLARFLQAPSRALLWCRQGHMWGPTLLLLQRHIKPQLSQAFSRYVLGDKLLDSFAFLAEFDFYLKVVCLADIFFLTSHSKSKHFVSPVCSPNCLVLFQALYFCLTLMERISPHTSRKHHPIFERFKLLLCFPLTFPTIIELFKNYSP